MVPKKWVWKKSGVLSEAKRAMGAFTIYKKEQNQTPGGKLFELRKRRRASFVTSSTSFFATEPAVPHNRVKKAGRWPGDEKDAVVARGVRIPALVRGENVPVSTLWGEIWGPRHRGYAVKKTAGNLRQQH